MSISWLGAVISWSFVFVVVFEKVLFGFWFSYFCFIHSASLLDLYHMSIFPPWILHLPIPATQINIDITCSVRRSMQRKLP